MAGALYTTSYIIARDSNDNSISKIVLESVTINNIQYHQTSADIVLHVYDRITIRNFSSTSIKQPVASTCKSTVRVHQESNNYYARFVCLCSIPVSILFLSTAENATR